MIIEFKWRSRYNGKRFMPGEQANIPEDVAKRLVTSGAAFFIEKKEILDAGGNSEGSNQNDNKESETDNDKDVAKLLDKKFNKDQLKEAAMEVDILVPSMNIKKDELIALIIEEGKAEEVLSLPDSANE